MTERELRKITAFWQRALQLDTWDIDIDVDEPAEVGNDAEASRSIFYDKATIRFEKDWRLWSTEHTHRIMVHELLHLLTRDLEQAHTSLEFNLHRDVWALADARYVHEIEGVIDRLAHRLVALAAPSN